MDYFKIISSLVICYNWTSKCLNKNLNVYIVSDDKRKWYAENWKVSL